MSLYLERGIPSQVGQKRVNFFLVKPSQAFFAEANPENGLEAMPDNCFFTFQELMEIPVKTAVKTGVVKQRVIEAISGTFPELGLGDMDPARIRLRDKTGEDKLTQVYHDQREFNRYQIFDGKEVAIQILDKCCEESED